MIKIQSRNPEQYLFSEVQSLNQKLKCRYLIFFITSQLIQSIGKSSENFSSKSDHFTGRNLLLYASILTTMWTPELVETTTQLLKTLLSGVLSLCGPLDIFCIHLELFRRLSFYPYLFTALTVDESQ